MANHPTKSALWASGKASCCQSLNQDISSRGQRRQSEGKSTSGGAARKRDGQHFPRPGVPRSAVLAQNSLSVLNRGKDARSAWTAARLQRFTASGRALPSFQDRKGRPDLRPPEPERETAATSISPPPRPSSPTVLEPMQPILPPSEAPPGGGSGGGAEKEQPPSSPPQPAHRSRRRERGGSAVERNSRHGESPKRPSRGRMELLLIPTLRCGRALRARAAAGSARARRLEGETPKPRCRRTRRCRLPQPGWAKDAPRAHTGDGWAGEEEKERGDWVNSSGALRGPAIG